MDLVIGLIGAKGAGKTTTFNLLAEYTDAKESMLADRLKETCSLVFNIPRHNFEDPKLKERPFSIPVYITRTDILNCAKLFNLKISDENVRPHIGKILLSPRNMLQYIGTEILRSNNPSIHCENVQIHEGISVVTDIRFMNEFLYFKENYDPFYMVYIQNTKAEVAASKDLHPSELGLRELKTKAHYVLHNNGTHDDLRKSVVSLLSKIEANIDVLSELRSKNV